MVYGIFDVVLVPETDSVPKNMVAQQISVRSQSGESTEITKLESVLNVEQNGQDEIFFRIPLILRQEYRFPAEKSSYPVTQEEPLQKDCTGAGTFLMTEENGEELVIAEGISPMLDVEAAEADMELSVIAQNEKMKAGQTIRYQVEIANTGKLDLADIRLTSSLSCPRSGSCGRCRRSSNRRGCGGICRIKSRREQELLCTGAASG